MAILGPIAFRIKAIGYELLFGIIAVPGLLLIFQLETQYAFGMLLALISAFFNVVFTSINGKLLKNERPMLIILYELGFGVFISTVFLAIQSVSMPRFFRRSQNNRLYLVVLTIDLGSVYGIILTFAIFGDSEKRTQRSM